MIKKYFLLCSCLALMGCGTPTLHITESIIPANAIQHFTPETNTGNTTSVVLANKNDIANVRKAFQTALDEHKSTFIVEIPSFLKDTALSLNAANQNIHVIITHSGNIPVGLNNVTFNIAAHEVTISNFIFQGSNHNFNTGLPLILASDKKINIKNIVMTQFYNRNPNELINIKALSQNTELYSENIYFIDNLVCYVSNNASGIYASFSKNINIINNNFCSNQAVMLDNSQYPHVTTSLEACSNYFHGNIKNVHLLVPDMSKQNVTMSDLYMRRDAVTSCPDSRDVMDLIHAGKWPILSELYSL